MQTLNEHQRIALAACRRADLTRMPSGFWQYRHKARSRLFSGKTIRSLEAKGLVFRFGERVIARENVR